MILNFSGHVAGTVRNRSLLKSIFQMFDLPVDDVDHVKSEIVILIFRMDGYKIKGCFFYALLLSPVDEKTGIHAKSCFPGFNFHKNQLLPTGHDQINFPKPAAEIFCHQGETQLPDIFRSPVFSVLSQFFPAISRSQA